MAITLMSMLATPATAHTETESTSPGAGETVAAGEQLVSISFTDSILDLANSSEIVIVDSSGKAVPTDCSGVEKKKFYTNAFLAVEGEYRVTWRTVAEDGHPITGKFSFQVTGNSETEYSKPACANDSPEPTPKVIAAPPVKKSEPPTDDSSLAIYLGALGVTTALGVMWLISKSRHRAKE